MSGSAVGGIIGLLASFLFLWLFIRRKRRKAKAYVRPTIDGGSIRPSSSLSIAAQSIRQPASLRMEERTTFGHPSQTEAETPIAGSHAGNMPHPAVDLAEAAGSDTDTLPPYEPYAPIARAVSVQRR